MGFDTGLIVSYDAEQHLAPMYISDLVRIIRILSELIGLFRHEERVLVCIIILDISIFG